jgi:hypothetical protein
MLNLLAFIALLSALVYAHANFRLHYVIAAERPEWVNAPIPFERFYTSIPRIAIPYVQFQVLKVALSSRARQLTSPVAAIYVRRIRFCLPLSVAAFYAAVFVSSSGGA